MEPLLVALIVGSALLHAAWNAALKLQRDPEGASTAILAVAAVTSGVAALALGGAPFPAREGVAWALAAGLCESGYLATLALAFRDAPLGVVYSIARGVAVVAIWPVSVLWLGEAVSLRSAAGAAVLTSGLVLVGLDRGKHTALRGVLWAVACALFIAGYHLSFKRALSTGAAPAGAFTVALVVALPVSAARLGRGWRSRSAAALRASPLVVAGAGVLCAASFLLFLVALSRGGAGAAVTLRNTSVLFALLLSWMMGERPGRWQVAGILGVAAGAMVLGWPGRG
jgi:drug/metabolite transporter (DMT)-like permease